MSVRILWILLAGFVHVLEVIGQCSSIKWSVVRPLLSLEQVLVTYYVKFAVGMALHEELVLKKATFI